MNVFRTTEEKNATIAFTFINSEIILTGYQIHSNLDGKYGTHLKSWVIEGKPAGETKWIVLDTQTDCDRLNDEDKIHYFKIEHSAPMGDIRLRMTGPNWNETNEISLSLIEFYGDLINLTIPDAEKCIQVFHHRLSLLRDHVIVAELQNNQLLKGLFYRMGNNVQKRVKMTSSESSFGDPMSVLSSTLDFWETTVLHDRWIQCEFLDGYVEVTSYSLRHCYDNFVSYYQYMKGWKLEGLTLDGEWIMLDEESDTTGLQDEGKVATFTLPQRSPAVKAIKITQSSNGGQDGMALGRFEIFGQYHF